MWLLSTQWNIISLRDCWIWNTLKDFSSLFRGAPFKIDVILETYMMGKIHAEQQGLKIWVLRYASTCDHTYAKHMCFVWLCQPFSNIVSTFGHNWSIGKSWSIGNTWSIASFVQNGNCCLAIDQHGFLVQFIIMVLGRLHQQIFL